jgi:diketogulonate reductase-like aldo/keto reductase
MYKQGCTEEEWKDAIAAGSTKSRDELVLHIKVIPTEKVSKPTTECGQASDLKPACCFR